MKTPPLTGSGEETLTFPLHASLNFLLSASDAATALDFILTLTSAAHFVSASRTAATDALAVWSSSARTRATVVSSSASCAATAYLLTAAVWQSTSAEAPTATSPASARVHRRLGRARRGAGDIRLDADGVAENLEGDLGGGDVLGVAADARDAIYGAGERWRRPTAGEGSLGLEGEALGDVEGGLDGAGDIGGALLPRGAAGELQAVEGGLLDVEGVLVVVGERPGDEVCARGVWEGRARVSESVG